MPEQRSVGTQWHGLNRSVAPNLLPENESPDTTDCAIQGYERSAAVQFGLLNASGGTINRGVLGQRNPRIRATVRPHVVLGCMALNLPWGRQTLIAEDNGNWTSIDNPWSDPVTPIPLNGWDRVGITALTVSQAGVGTTLGTAQVLAQAATMDNYGLMLVGDAVSYLTDEAISISGTVTDGTITLQGLIGGIWTDLRSWRVQPLSAIDIAQLYTSGTGSLTQVRLKSVVDVGTGTLAATLTCSLFLLYGIEQGSTTAS